MTEFMTRRFTAMGTYTKPFCTMAGQCWLPRAAFDELLGGQLLEAAEIDDKHIAQIDFADDGLFHFFVPKEDVAIVEEHVAVEGYCNGLAISGIFAEPVFLRVPLAEFKRINGGIGQPSLPHGIIAVAEYVFYELHGVSFL